MKYHNKIFLFSVLLFTFLFVSFSSITEVNAAENYDTNGTVSFIVDPDNPDHKVTPQKPNIDNDSSKNQKVINNDKGKVTETVKPDKNYDVVSSDDINKNNSEKKLPDTDYDNNSIYSLVGILFGNVLFFWRSKKNN